MNELELIKQFAQIVAIGSALIAAFGMICIIGSIMWSEDDKPEYGGWK